MNDHELPRRDFLKLLAGALPAAVIDWDALPFGPAHAPEATDADVIVIGSGLAGLSCAAAFARQGFRPLVFEQHDKPGGYATAFARPGGFRFDVSLHATGTQERGGLYNLIGGFPEITDVEFLPHPTLYRAIYPGHDLTVRQRDPAGFVGTLIRFFPDEKEGIGALFADMQGLAAEVGKFQRAGSAIDWSRFAEDFPFLNALTKKSWGQMMERRLKDPHLKALFSSQWAYYGLPPSKLSCFYYALPLLGYLAHGGFYPKGRSQDISNALVRFIEGRGGKVVLNTRVERILVRGGAAQGVATADGREFRSRAVVSNADPFSTLERMNPDRAAVAGLLASFRGYSVSASCFQVFLGLKEDVVGRSGVRDSEIFLEPSYDLEASYRQALAGDVENGGVAVTLYDNINPAYSPAGKNTLNILTLQGYGPWERFERDYLAGKKDEYRKEKERMADILIAKAEKALLPGLRSAVEVREIGTPLTNLRYTGHHRGAIYGWDQTVNNTGFERVGHSTPVKNLYMAGAWTRPGHGYGAVIPSGLECAAEIMKAW